MYRRCCAKLLECAEREHVPDYDRIYVPITLTPLVLPSASMEALGCFFIQLPRFFDSFRGCSSILERLVHENRRGIQIELENSKNTKNNLFPGRSAEKAKETCSVIVTHIAWPMIERERRQRHSLAGERYLATTVLCSVN